MTSRLYYTDSYLREFEASVIDSSHDGRRVYLDRTAFYPTSGGQPHDTGSLGGVEVVDVIDEAERIAHLIAAPLPRGPAAGRLDWERRFDHMQQHTGQHLLSAVFADLFGGTTVSVHFGRESSTLDLDLPALEHERLVTAEARANAIVVENRSVEVSFEQSESAGGLRKASTREGDLRIVTIHDLDRSACGGTHVRATGEIGPILLTGTERVKKQLRVEFVCGNRAVRRARADHDLLSRLAAPLSASPADLPAIFDAQRQELKDSAAARRALEEELDRLRAGELYATATPAASGVRTVLVREERGSVDRLRGLARAVTALPGAVFAGTLTDPPTVIMATSADTGVDAGRALKTALERLGGRGGGNARVAQGSAPAEALDAVVQEMLRRAD